MKYGSFEPIREDWIHEQRLGRVRHLSIMRIMAMRAKASTVRSGIALEITHKAAVAAGPSERSFDSRRRQNRLYEWKSLVGLLKNQYCLVAILHVVGMNDDAQQQAERVDEHIDSTSFFDRLKLAMITNRQGAIRPDKSLPGSTMIDFDERRREQMIFKHILENKP